MFLYVRDGFVQASSPNSAYVHTCQAGCHGRLSATIFFFFFPFLFICFYSLLTISQHRIFLGSCSGIDLPIKTRDKFLNYSPKSYHPLEHQLQTVGFLVSNEAKTPPRYLSGSLLSQKRRGKQKITKNKENLAYVYWLYRLLCCILGLYTNSKLVRAIVFYIWYSRRHRMTQDECMPHSSSNSFLISFRAQHRERIIPKTTTKMSVSPSRRAATKQMMMMRKHPKNL